jgi:hypothetical protein
MRNGLRMRLRISSNVLEKGFSFNIPTFMKIFATALNMMEKMRTII